ncbi:MAG: metal-binding protein, partial [Pseudomonas putida]
MLPALSEKELDRLEDLLITYGNDYSVLNLAEL